jgi:TPR repeat protein
MPISRAIRPLATASLFAALLWSAAPAALAQTAVDAAQAMASAMDGAGGGISSTEQIAALQDAAAAGDPMAQWQLGLMYESGEGVAQDKAKAFGYFAQIADEHADTAPKGLEADIVAHSFVKMGEYYKEGLPEAGVAKDEDYANRLILHAASYFGDADAQYRVGELYLDEKELGDNPLQSARWLSLAARKGHAPAQAKLGDILFNGDGGLPANRVEGLMWLTVANRHSVGTGDAGWIEDLLNSAMSVATPDERKQAVDLADTLNPKFGG